MIQVFKPKRRDVLRTATGLAAAAVVGGSLAGGQEVAAQRGARGKDEIIANIESIGEFAVLSFSWGLSHPDSEGSGQTSSRVTPTDIVIIKPTDKSSPKLVEAVTVGTSDLDAVITGVASGAGGSTNYVYQLTKVRITSYAVSGGSDGGVPLETLSLNFSEVKFVVDSAQFTWNFDLNKPS